MKTPLYKYRAQHKISNLIIYRLNHWKIMAGLIIKNYESTKQIGFKIEFERSQRLYFAGTSFISATSKNWPEIIRQAQLLSRQADTILRNDP